LLEFERLCRDRRRFADAYRKFLDKYSLQAIGLEKDFAAVTRDNSTGRNVSVRRFKSR